ncbi:hypothetical protein SDJN02_13422 [Cucurbita argyrosperma subsp. argyrosperma]|nr:hypothetical protein SDJN02_13422 [Cucurbita argyrosperma subsp. argyrosperma]
MASMESETPDVLNETRNGNKKKNGIRMESFYLRKIGFGCFRVQQDEEGNFDMEVVNGDGERRKPTHLLIMVNGLVGRTGRHLFLLDKDSENRPLLLHMAGDHEDLKFLSALQSFRRRVTYANKRYDNVVGWSTSSIRRRTELPKLEGVSIDDKYPYIVNVETAKVSSPQIYVPSEAKGNRFKKTEVEEEMIKRLSSVGWERVDVDFHRSKQRNNAHLTIQARFLSGIHRTRFDLDLVLEIVAEIQQEPNKEQNLLHTNRLLGKATEDKFGKDGGNDKLQMIDPPCYYGRRSEPVNSATQFLPCCPTSDACNHTE